MKRNQTNSANNTCFYLLLDYQPPTLTCPEDTSVDNDAGKNTSSVSWNFTFTDNSLTENEPGITEINFDVVLTINGVNVSLTLPKLLGIGESEMKYFVEDDMGNTASCTFKYVVNGK